MYIVKSKPLMGIVQFFLSLHACTLDINKAMTFQSATEARKDISRRALEPYSFCENDWIVIEVKK